MKTRSGVYGLAAVALVAAAVSLGASEDLMKGKVKTDKSIVLEAVVDGPRGEVFQLWMSAEGVKRFFATDARIEPRVGGRYEMIFNPKSDPEGTSYGTKGARILKLQPGRLLAFEWIPFLREDLSSDPGGPPAIPAAERNEMPIPTWVEVTFEDVAGAPEKTRVKLAHHGFRSGGKWGESYIYFSKAWDYVLKQLTAQFQPKKAS